VEDSSELIQAALSLTDRIKGEDYTLAQSDKAATNVLNDVKGLYRAYNLRDARTDADQASKLLRSALDDAEWTEKGLAEWRSVALENSRHAEAARATARIAIAHLDNVLNNCRAHDHQTSADTQARDWLLSIGSLAD